MISYLEKFSEYGGTI